MGYDPAERHRKIEERVIQKKVGGDLRKYYRFRHDRSGGGMITADCGGCGLTCKFCWAHPEQLEGREQGEWLSADQVVAKLFQLMREQKIHQLRFSGGEPTIGRKHLLQILNALQRKRVRFILETNGILIGEDETYAQELALYPFVHVRVSFKGCTEEEFALLSGADAKGFPLQLAALRNLIKAGVSAHPAVMYSFSRKEVLDRFYGTIWKIDSRLHSEVEMEELILYPSIDKTLQRANLKYYSAHTPDRRPQTADRRSARK